MTLYTGECLCGQVRFRCEGEPMITGHCHCVDCRKSSGTGHCTHIALMAPDMSVEGTVKFYARPSDSGNIVRRGFCADCGSPLWSTNDSSAGAIFLRASSLDDPDMAVPQLTVYASRATKWDAPAAGLPAFAVMPPGGAEAVYERGSGEV